MPSFRASNQLVLTKINLQLPTTIAIRTTYKSPPALRSSICHRIAVFRPGLLAHHTCSPHHFGPSRCHSTSAQTRSANYLRLITLPEPMQTPSACPESPEAIAPLTTNPTPKSRREYPNLFARHLIQRSLDFSLCHSKVMLKSWTGGHFTDNRLPEDPSSPDIC